MFEIKDLTIDYVPSPTAAPVRGLRFGWKPDADGEGVLQESYRITVSDRDGHLFDSGVVRCDRVENIEPGFVLQTRTDYRVRVSVRNNRGETAEGESCFSTEIGRDEWTAKWIRPKKFIDGWSPFLRKKFEVSQPVVSAKLYACGLGCGEFYLNGEKVGDALIDPPATNYDKRVLYRAYDVTDRIRDKNALAIWLGEGWYAQSRVWEGGLRYGRECAILQLELTLRDGSKQTVCTDEGWLSKYSPISLNNLYGGECYDGRLETPDFALYDCDESEFGPVVLDETPKGELCPCNIPPVRVIRRIPAQEVWGLSGVSDGAWVVDMGENFAGVAEFHIPPSPRGAVYVFRYSEAVAPDGHPDYRSSGSFATQCVQQDIYIARGDKDGEVWTPRFCYHGFRYIEVTGHHDYKAYSVMPGKDFCVGLALSTDLRPSGDFRCGYPPMNDLRDIALRTFLSNYHGYPEDCPAREKCGWLGDAQLVADWALYEFDLCACYEKYIRDILDTKEVYGELQMISPGKRGCGEATPLWGCAQVMLPYDLLLYCGNSRIIRESFPSIESWVAHEIGRSDDLIIKDGLGDWCPPVGHQSERRIPVAQSSTLQLYEICEKTAVLCRLTGLGDAGYYERMAREVRDSFIRHFYDQENHTYGTWGADGAALTLGVYPDGEQEALAAALLARIRADDYAMPLGIYGTKYTVPWLFEHGYGDEALRFLFHENQPSFMTMMRGGASTVWESLAMALPQPDRQVKVQSYNHPMHTGFLYLYYACIGGIRPLSPGYRHFEIKVCHTEAIPEADVRFDSPYGLIRSAWKREGGRYAYRFTVPAGAECTLRFPDGMRVTLDGKASENTRTVGSGLHTAVAEKM